MKRLIPRGQKCRGTGIALRRCRGYRKRRCGDRVSSAGASPRDNDGGIGGNQLRKSLWHVKVDLFMFSSVHAGNND